MFGCCGLPCSESAGCIPRSRGSQETRNFAGLRLVNSCQSPPGKLVFLRAHTHEYPNQMTIVSDFSVNFPIFARLKWTLRIANLGFLFFCRNGRCMIFPANCVNGLSNEKYWLQPLHTRDLPLIIQHGGVGRGEISLSLSLRYTRSV